MILLLILVAGVTLSQNDLGQQPLAVIGIILFTFYFIVFCTRFWTNSRLITINLFEKKITYTHFFTRRKVTYLFEDLEGYVEVIQAPARGNRFRMIYLVQDKKYIDEISSFAYSNYDELKEGLKKLKYLGQQEHSYLDYLKILIGQKELKD
jgi:hypothetical protein